MVVLFAAFGWFPFYVGIWYDFFEYNANSLGVQKDSKKKACNHIKPKDSNPAVQNSKKQSESGDRCQTQVDDQSVEYMQSAKKRKHDVIQPGKEKTGIEDVYKA